jgi:hypothetical protein
VLAVPRCAVYLAGLAAASCGRVGFDLVARAPPADASIDVALTDDAPPDAASARIAYVGPFVQRDGGVGATDSFTASVRAAGDAIILQVSCGDPQIPTAVTVSAPGWAFGWVQNAITASNSSDERSATFFAVAPAAGDVTVAVQWASGCTTGKNHIGDEFTLIDAGGGPATGAIAIDRFNQVEGTGDCVGTVTAERAGDAVWAACDSEGKVSEIGAGFAKGADDGIGDWSEYLLADAPAGAMESVRFTNANVGYVLSMATLTAR